MRYRYCLPLVLALSAICSAYGQDPESSSLPSVDLTLKSLESSELFALFFQTLQTQEEQLQADRLNLQAFSDYMGQQLDALMMQTLDSRRTAQRAERALQAAKLALTSSEQSVGSLKDEAKSALEAARWWRAGAFIAGGVAVALARLCIGLAGN